ncbi:hypothetical protein NDU88_003634 [Pleurodeles waltl]|uniref:Uncharacterized protein n=1 Tax=Pleurodeles waltl TaxID=8319 RepID=A0AAV7UEM0_PLEWA|nr:hypothetical protein NDU88_003634 [Pleurodeles waltl]
MQEHDVRLTAGRRHPPEEKPRHRCNPLHACIVYERCSSIGVLPTPKLTVDLGQERQCRLGMVAAEVPCWAEAAIALCEQHAMQ